MTYPFGTKTWNDRCLLASRLLKGNEHILDLGSGKENLKKFIKYSSYTPVDKFNVYDHTIVSDFDKNYPVLPRDDYTIVVLGLLEYLEDVPKFFEEIKKYGKNIIFSYYQKKDPIPTWKNNYTYTEIIEIFIKSGWKIKYIEAIKNTKELVFVGEL